ncbi:MAG: primosomal protein N' [Bacilli bacterium]|nr:primosomal protein N' [Bacilli bacterium]
MIASVLLEIKAKNVDKTFDYNIPEFLKSIIKVGMRVLVPFGARELEGYVIKIKETNDIEIELKEILKNVDDEVILNEELLAIGKYIQENMLVSLSSAYSTMLPSALKAHKKTQISRKYESYLSLKIPYEQAYALCKNEVQKQIIEMFQDGLLISKKEAQEISSSAIKTLIKNDILQEEKEESYRYQVKEFLRDDKKNLNEEQSNALEKIKNAFGKSKTILLRGVTGSGKTEVYMQCIEEMQKQGKQALVLVPEISLTPQFIRNFARRFGDNIAVLHSGLSDGEKYDEWRKIMRNEISIVIGARSAIFAPLINIGIIIIDECHSDSYKQENRPKYHAQDIALFRANYHKCPLILGSATPSLEAFSRAKKGVFELIELNHRVNQNPLPEVTIVDMAKEVKKHHFIISELLEMKIADRLNKKEQIMILLNRRGHSTTINCSSCGFTYKCPYCDITLTFHKSTKNLRCHYCGYTKFLDDVCPNCHEDALNYYGLGTEKLESALKEKFPNARMIRMDTDTTNKKGALEKIEEEFRDHHYDIVIGTQMISKGHDYPNVTLVGIVNADITLNIPDFRSGEKTFALLYQASGRAGRGSLKGEVVIETFNPDNHILNCVKDQDFLRFYEYEMNIRKTLKYPPFYYLAHLVIKSKSYENAKTEATKVASFLKRKLSKTSIVLGPTTANMFRINNVYHFEIMIKYRFDDFLKSALKELDELFLLNRQVDLDIDISY